MSYAFVSCLLYCIASYFSMTPLRILCLHGYRQNGTMFREKTGSLRKLLKKHVAEFVFIDAPHIILAQDNTNEQDPNATATGRSNERGIHFERFYCRIRSNHHLGFSVYFRLVVFIFGSNLRSVSSHFL